MPRITREPIWLLPHRKKSGLFLTQDGYVADVKPDDGGRIVRRYGKDRGRAIHLFEGLLTGLAQQTEDRDNPPVTTFLTDAFLPTQKRLKSYRFSLSGLSLGLLRCHMCVCDWPNHVCIFCT